MGDLSRSGVAIDSELLRRFDRFIAQQGMRTAPKRFAISSATGWSAQRWSLPTLSWWGR
jgi:hypothetical protein